ncbi:hypothetical protein OEZ85_012293 [Tetradesmus obliquus]|uniref:Uncharacterized protein n=1 Tax=Tetradesmus obliquus TaxID=3088 RepID=A0ABY8TWW4_TETOB|nr:hypothetical protein OEZ85_012293 [Tetradesmus obliquus]
MDLRGHVEARQALSALQQLLTQPPPRLQELHLDMGDNWSLSDTLMPTLDMSRMQHLQRFVRPQELPKACSTWQELAAGVAGIVAAKALTKLYSWTSFLVDADGDQAQAAAGTPVAITAAGRQQAGVLVGGLGKAGTTAGAHTKYRVLLSEGLQLQDIGISDIWPVEQRPAQPGSAALLRKLLPFILLDAPTAMGLQHAWNFQVCAAQQHRPGAMGSLPGAFGA